MEKLNKQFEEILKSWRKSTSYVNPKIRNATDEFQRNFYQDCLTMATTFGAKVSFKMVHHTDFLLDPRRILVETLMWLGLPPWKFDVGLVNSNIDIKKILRNGL